MSKHYLAYGLWEKGTLKAADDCGCRFQVTAGELPSVEPCPLHAAAPKLLAALEGLWPWLKTIPEPKGIFARETLACLKEKAREAIAEAKEESHEAVSD